MATYRVFPEDAPERIGAAPTTQVSTDGDRDLGLADGKDAAYLAVLTYLLPHFRGYVISGVEYHAFDAHSFGDENYFDRIWVVPTEIDFGFLTEDSTDSFYVWNAWLSKPVTITSIDLTGTTTGISTDAPSLPFSLATFGELTVEVAITAEGEPQQNSTYTLTIDGEPYEVDITALRVLSMAPDPDWNYGIRISYAWATVMFENEYFVEQRRPKSPLSWRTVRVSYHMDQESAADFFNWMLYGKDKLFAIPIYNEKMIPTDLTVAGTTITTSGSNQYLWNLQNRATHVAILDHASLLAEVKEIDAITDTTHIETTVAIQDTFDVSSTYVYPVVMGFVQSIRITPQSDTTDVVEVEYVEYVG